MKSVLPIKIGMRTFKTALSVGLCILLFDSIKRGSPVLACLAAVYCTRADTPTSFAFTKHRLIGTFIGGLFAMLALAVQPFLPKNIFTLAIIGFFGIIGIILTCTLAKHPEGIVTSSATFLIIIFNTEYDETVHYAVQRMFDVLIGASIALIINHFLPNNLKKSS